MLLMKTTGKVMYAVLAAAGISSCLSTGRSLVGAQNRSLACAVMTEFIRGGTVEPGCLASPDTEKKLAALNPRFAGTASKMEAPVAAFQAERQKRSQPNVCHVPVPEPALTLSREAYLALEAGLVGKPTGVEKADFYFTGAFTLAGTEASASGANAAVYGREVIAGVNLLLAQCKKGSI